MRIFGIIKPNEIIYNIDAVCLLVSIYQNIIVATTSLF